MLPLTERYYQYFHTERSADALARFLEGHPDLSVVQLVEVLLMDQALQWKEAAGPSVEEYLVRFRAVADQPSLVLELVYGELRAARALGLTVDVAVYENRFPDLAAPLRRQIEVSTWLEDDGTGKKRTDQPRSEPD